MRILCSGRVSLTTETRGLGRARASQEKLEPVDVGPWDEGKYVDGLNSYLFFPGPDVDIITGR